MVGGCGCDTALKGKERDCWAFRLEREMRLKRANHSPLSSHVPGVHSRIGTSSSAPKRGSRVLESLHRAPPSGPSTQPLHLSISPIAHSASLSQPVPGPCSLNQLLTLLNLPYQGRGRYSLPAQASKLQARSPGSPPPSCRRKPLGQRSPFDRLTRAHVAHCERSAAVKLGEPPYRIHRLCMTASSPTCTLWDTFCASKSWCPAFAVPLQRLQLWTRVHLHA